MNPADAWSTPLDAPLVPPFPFQYRNAEVLTLVYRTTPEAVRRLIPAPLVPTSNRVLIHLYNMNDTDWHHGLQTHARRPRRLQARRVRFRGELEFQTHQPH